MKVERQRRSAEEARHAILEAAERRLLRDGPAALRLQDLADDVGVSHPAILHHFGSREGLVRAVVERAVENLQNDLKRALTPAAGSLPDGSALFEHVFEALAQHGHARLMAWLLLSGYDPFPSEAVRSSWAQIGKTTHALRPAATGRGPKPSYEDTQFTIVLSALALFGQAIAGPATFNAAGLGRSARVERRFRKWLAALLARHLADATRLDEKEGAPG